MTAQVEAVRSTIGAVHAFPPVQFPTEVLTLDQLIFSSRGHGLFSSAQE
jgi:hypothetical protein